MAFKPKSVAKKLMNLIGTAADGPRRKNEFPCILVNASLYIPRIISVDE
jgi:hypothetical protein